MGLQWGYSGVTVGVTVGHGALQPLLGLLSFFPNLQQGLTYQKIFTWPASKISHFSIQIIYDLEENIA